jgi:hypothetical protein
MTWVAYSDWTLIEKAMFFAMAASTGTVLVYLIKLYLRLRKEDEGGVR